MRLRGVTDRLERDRGVLRMEPGRDSSPALLRGSVPVEAMIPRSASRVQIYSGGSPREPSSRDPIGSDGAGASPGPASSSSVTHPERSRHCACSAARIILTDGGEIGHVRLPGVFPSIGHASSPYAAKPCEHRAGGCSPAGATRWRRPLRLLLRPSPARRGARCKRLCIDHCRQGPLLAPCDMTHGPDAHGRRDDPQMDAPRRVMLVGMARALPAIRPMGPPSYDRDVQ